MMESRLNHCRSESRVTLFHGQIISRNYFIVLFLNNVFTHIKTKKTTKKKKSSFVKHVRIKNISNHTYNIQIMEQFTDKLAFFLSYTFINSSIFTT